jgi:N-hydroxyarylamine O-acetyltransferase
LRALHRLHPQAIAFENLSTLRGEPVALDIEALHDKLVRQRRGGYCFEQNTLFAHVLEEIGFTVVPLAARVVWNRERGYVNPRTHMALLVGAGGGEYLCDVGFGGATLTAPLIFEPGIEQQTPHEIFIINKLEDIFRVDVKFSEGWRPAFEFDLQPQLAVDYAAMNHYVQTWPDSPFRRVLMAGRPDATGRWALGGNELSRYEGGRLVERRRITSASDLKSLLTNEFRITLAPDPGLDSALERVVAAKAL